MAPGRERAVEAEHERLPEEILERLHPADADRLVEAVLPGRFVEGHVHTQRPGGFLCAKKPRLETRGQRV